MTNEVVEPDIATDFINLTPIQYKENIAPNFQQNLAEYESNPSASQFKVAELETNGKIDSFVKILNYRYNYICIV